MCNTHHRDQVERLVRNNNERLQKNDCCMLSAMTSLDPKSLHPRAADTAYSQIAAPKSFTKEHTFDVDAEVQGIAAAHTNLVQVLKVSSDTVKHSSIQQCRQ